MIDDLNNLPDEHLFKCDLCVIGSGAAGIALAREFIMTSASVIVVESGGRTFEAATQQLYDCQVVGLPFNGHIAGRFRTFGGSTTRWGGQSLPLDPLDFEPRDWVANSGWPIKYGELAAYYQRGASFLKTDQLNFDSDLCKLLRFDPPQFDPQFVHYHFTKWAPRPNIGDIYATEIKNSKKVRLMFHANVTRITLNENLNRVSELTVRSLEGKTGTIKARHVVLAAGGLETARLLLCNDHQQKQGIGNAHDLVGRFLQDHPTASVAQLSSANPDELQRLFHTFYHRGLKYAPRISLAATAQRENRILNASVAIAFSSPSESPYQKLKDSVGQLLRRRGSVKDLATVANGLLRMKNVARPIWMLAARGRGYTPDPLISVAMFTEQEPNPMSRIRLGASADRLGERMAQIDWRPTRLTGQTFSVYIQILEREFARLRLGKLEICRWLRDGGTEWESHIHDLNHHMGTTRMSASSEHGVVDPHCRVHGVDNLWIASSSVFPTGGHSNPTLTILALTFRIADELKRELAEQGR